MQRLAACASALARASSANARPCVAPLPPLIHRQGRPPLFSSSPSLASGGRAERRILGMQAELAAMRLAPELARIMVLV